MRLPNTYQEQSLETLNIKLMRLLPWVQDQQKLRAHLNRISQVQLYQELLRKSYKCFNCENCLAS